jgi:manganese/zinc/iron transport system permease protein
MELFLQFLNDMVFNYTLRNIALGAGLLGLVSGVLGSFALLRRQSLLGDALSHAALPGVCAAFLLTNGSKSPLVLLLGAAIAGWLGALLMTVTVRNTRIKEDAALGIVLSVFFGVGYFMLSLMQKTAGAGQAGLDKFLFGSAASLIESDVQIMFVLGGIALGVVFALYKEFKALSFDPSFLATLGYPVRHLDILLTTLVVIAVVIGLQTVGVVLMSAMLIAPGAAARQWTNRLGIMIGIAMGIGAGAGVVGAMISATAQKVPTGPSIVLVLTTITVFSLAFGMQRGIVWRWLRMRRTNEILRSSSALPVGSGAD